MYKVTVVVEVETAVADRPHHESKALLLPDLDVAVAPHIPGDRWEHCLVLRLLGVRMGHFARWIVRSSLSSLGKVLSIFEGSKLSTDSRHKLGAMTAEAES